MKLSELSSLYVDDDALHGLDPDWLEAHDGTEADGTSSLQCSVVGYSQSISRWSNPKASVYLARFFANANLYSS